MDNCNKILCDSDLLRRPSSLITCISLHGIIKVKLEDISSDGILDTIKYKKITGRNKVSNEELNYINFFLRNREKNGENLGEIINIYFDCYLKNRIFGLSWKDFLRKYPSTRILLQSPFITIDMFSSFFSPCSIKSRPNSVINEVQHAIIELQYCNNGFWIIRPSSVGKTCDLFFKNARKKGLLKLLYYHISFYTLSFKKCGKIWHRRFVLAPGKGWCNLHTSASFNIDKSPPEFYGRWHLSLIDCIEDILKANSLTFNFKN